jgi:hypothetical protein
MSPMIAYLEEFDNFDTLLLTLFKINYFLI